MEHLAYRYSVDRRARGERLLAIVGVVASGNLEVLVERVLPDTDCEVVVNTAVRGFADVWKAVIGDFVAQARTGGLRMSINDGGARPDTVSLRLAQAVASIAEDA
ncbi:malonate decarboxylase acyl carrier protein [Paraburkholderia rhizosphaerae]|uniref:Malonate decarboxylase acyl carrier protein n=1 Tax=Paraburkholderia rhizosphaerae TaxID=480658 RepID=A0A4R8M1L7_9BURK|nr:malonate decarboxylase acyl carrier protein [Paraburkholderia rhizosphaerae]TDY54744.1 malonate decarboxylase delta subunit [Paraburkholderia rhizosphaerae]